MGRERYQILFGESPVFHKRKKLLKTASFYKLRREIVCVLGAIIPFPSLVSDEFACLLTREQIFLGQTGLEREDKK